MNTKSKYCRFCCEDLSKQRNSFRHEVGLCIPSRNEVDTAIAALEIEDEREKEAIRKFWDREREQRPGMFISGKELLLFFGRVLLLTVGIIFTCYMVVIAVAAWFNLW